MNDRQENRLSSYRTTAQVLADNSDLVGTIPALRTQYGKLNDSLNLIGSLAALQGADTKGITEAKKEVLRQMKQFSFLVAGAVTAYASETGNLELKQQVKINDSIYQKLRDNRKAEPAQRIHDVARANLAALESYNITDATLSAFQTRIDTWRVAVPGPSHARSQRRSKTELLDTELRRADMICKERLDGLMEQFHETQPDFYNTYHASRDIVDTGHRKRKAPETATAPTTN